MRGLLIAVLGLATLGCGRAPVEDAKKGKEGRARRHTFSRRALGHATNWSDAPGAWAIAFSPDGKYVLTGLDVKRWDVATGKTVPWPQDRSFWAQALAYLPDGKHFATGGSDGLVTVRDAFTGREQRRLKGHTKKICALGVSADGKRLLSGSEDGTARLWDLESGRLLHTLAGHRGKVTSVALSPDARWALSCSPRDGERNKGFVFRVWDLKTGEQVSGPWGHSHAIYAVTVSPDGRRLASGDWDGVVKLWELASGREVRTLKMWPGEDKLVRELAFLPDGQRLLVASDGWDGLQCWDIRSGKEVLSFEDCPTSVKYLKVTSDGRRALSSSQGGHVIVWDLATGEEIRTLTGWPTETPTIRAVAFSPDGRLALSAGGCDVERVKKLRDEARVEGRKFEYSLGIIKVWDIRSGRLLRVLRGHKREVATAVFLKGGKQILSGGGAGDGMLRLWDTRTGKELRQLTELKGEKCCLSVSPDERLLAIGGREGQLKLFELSTGKLLKNLRGDQKKIYRVHFCSDGKHVLTSGAERAVKFWDVGTGQCVKTWPLTGAAVAFSVDGRLALGFNGSLLDLTTGTTLCVLPVARDDLSNASFSPDGKLVATTGQEGVVKLWDVVSGKLMHTLFGKRVPESFRSVAFSPDGRDVLAGGNGGRLKVWSVWAERERLSLVADPDW